MLGRWTGPGAAAIAITAALALSACGSDDDGGSTAASTGGSTAAATTGSTATTGGTSGAANPPASSADAVKTATEYTGATAGAADESKDPIGIGWANADEGGAPQPEMTHAMRAGVEFINKELGGVNGRPLKLIEDNQCVLGASEKQGTLCAQNLLNNADVDIVMFGYAPVGGRAFLATMAGKPEVPVIGAVPLSPTDFNAKSSFFTSAGPFAFNSIATYLTDVLKAKTVAEIWPEDPTRAAFVEGYEAAVKGAGVKVTSASIPPESTDVLAGVTAAQPATQDAIQVNAYTPGQCVAMEKALGTLGAADVPTIGGGSVCLDPSVKDQLGDFPKYAYSFSYQNVLIADPTGQTSALAYALDTYQADTAAKDLNGFYVPQYFGLLMTVQKWLIEAGGETVDTETLRPVITKFTGPIWGGADKLEFGTAAAPSIASFATRFSQYDGDGKWKYVSEWLNPPPPAS